VGTPNRLDKSLSARYRESSAMTPGSSTPPLLADAPPRRKRGNSVALTRQGLELGSTF
jgi:hypothetical protein